MTTPHLADLTTAAVGGPARHYVRAETEQAVVDAVAEADAAGRDVLVVGGGSNLITADAGYAGTVVHVASRGVQAVAEDAGGVLLEVQAGHSWDELVAQAVAEGLVGIEALSGIPGTTGATPVQNVGAYGQEVAQTVELVRVWDRHERRVREFAPAELAFAYRDSALKRSTVDGSPRHVVLAVRFRLARGADSAPVRYGELARRLGVEVGERAPLARVRETVLALRAGKGMVLDPADRDTYSTGSFFTNPILPAAALGDRLPADAPRFPVVDAAGNPLAGRVKLSAAWLIDHAGFGKGFGLPGTRNEVLDLDGAAVAGGRASLSTKHTLALTNRGDASAADLMALARTVRDGVASVYGVDLVAEPVIVGTGV
ncbi:UDP-N-acetylmuramate dehydrogenase [Kocuria turfanensis]|uniref:UDP-N-acetylenolpyruvoylglucosamine reductase n=1 Tax=Kocuria turfanensis TaxID=388357 RepID=A0A512IB71_9MICC|nr:UDP-N-acetylmuramate dehydrogenase [Kocuria turfanensis]GEO94955.1 UDP-N-acetylenolpyruvoylglucosamine reductase [Kocuria turfanensis]